MRILNFFHFCFFVGVDPDDVLVFAYDGTLRNGRRSLFCVWRSGLKTVYPLDRITDPRVVLYDSIVELQGLRTRDKQFFRDAMRLKHQQMEQMEIEFEAKSREVELLKTSNDRLANRIRDVRTEKLV